MFEIEIDNIVFPAFGNPVDELFHEIALRVYYADPVAIHNVLISKRVEQGGLPVS